MLHISFNIKMVVTIKNANVKIVRYLLLMSNIKRTQGVEIFNFRPMFV